nr:MAG TPA: hypothetical protein [Bacteriophage sp.]
MSRSIQNYVLSLQQKLYPKIVGKMHKSCFFRHFQKIVYCKHTWFCD